MSALIRPFGVMGYQCSSADFDGSNDWMNRGAGLSGAADGSRGTFSCWIRKDGGDGAAQRFISNVNGFVVLRISNVNKFFMDLTNSTGALAVTVQADTTTILAGTAWHQIVASWDTNFAAGSKLFKVVIDGVTQSLTVGDAAAAFNIDYTRADWAIGGDTAGGNRLNGCLAELFFDTVNYLDVTVPANLAKWRGGGKPVSLGANGSTPFSVQPIVYQKVAFPSGVPANFATNLGNGGNWVITGTLTLGSTSPSN